MIRHGEQQHLSCLLTLSSGWGWTEEEGERIKSNFKASSMTVLNSTHSGFSLVHCKNKHQAHFSLQTRMTTAAVSPDVQNL